MKWREYSAFLQIYDDVASCGKVLGNQTTSFEDIDDAVFLGGASSQSSGFVSPTTPLTHKHECFCKIAQRRATATAATQTIQILNDTLRLFGPSCINLSFNGGKDAVVSAVLYAASLANFYRNHSDMRRERPKAVYFRSNSEKHFPEVDQFIESFSQQMDFDLRIVRQDYIEGLKKYLETTNTCAGPQLMILGNRKGDPRSSHLGSFEPSSDWLPAFLRVHPLLRWSYGSVWDFLFWHDTPYCDLYNRGYTSIGTMTNTSPNPALELSTGEFLAASCLREPEWKGERWGRGPVRVMGDAQVYVSSKVLQKCSPMRCYTKTAWRLAIRTGSTAGLIIIGDEVLKGRIEDTNSCLAVEKLRSIGWKVGSVIVVPDDVDLIAEEVRKQSQQYDIVITSGGVGPTHDDVTIEAIARALRQKLRPVAELVPAGLDDDSVFGAKPAEVNFSRIGLQRAAELCDFRMSRQEKSAHRLWPVKQCSNVFVLPGVPMLFEMKLEIIVKEFLAPRPVGYLQRVCLAAHESAFAAILSEVNSEKAESVCIGSYPRAFNNDLDRDILSVVIFDGCVEEEVAASVKTFLSRLTSKVIVRVDNEGRIL